MYVFDKRPEPSLPVCCSERPRVSNLAETLSCKRSPSRLLPSQRFILSAIPYPPTSPQPSPSVHCKVYLVRFQKVETCNAALLAKRSDVEGPRWRKGVEHELVHSNRLRRSAERLDLLELISKRGINGLGWCRRIGSRYSTCSSFSHSWTLPK